MPSARSQDAFLEMMKRDGIPLTREKYIELATAGGATPWTAEHEAELPEELREPR